MWVSCHETFKEKAYREGEKANTILSAAYLINVWLVLVKVMLTIEEEERKTLSSKFIQTEDSFHS